MHEPQQETVQIHVNGKPVRVAAGSTVAVALTLTEQACRISVRHEERSPLCAMGICMECRVTIDGVPSRLACQTLCSPDMHVRTHG